MRRGRDPDELVAIGRILAPHGVKGEVKVEPLTFDPKRFEELRDIYVLREKGVAASPRELQRVRFHKGLLIVKFSGCEDRNTAELFRRGYIMIEEKQRLQLPEDTYFIDDILGMDVVTEEGEYLGRVVDVMQLGANDVYVLEGEKGEILLPAIKDVIKEVRLEEKKMIVHIIEGLL